MNNQRIRKKIEADNYGTLIGFENCVTPVEFYKAPDGYYIYRANTEMTMEDMICHTKNIEGLVQFMQGALWYRLNGAENVLKCREVD